MFAPQYLWVSGKKQLLSCAGDRHIKFSVYYIFIFLKSIGRQEIQLTEILYGKRIDDYITLASLIAFYRINGIWASSGIPFLAISLRIIAI